MQEETRLNALDDFNSLQHYVREIGGVLTDKPIYEYILTLSSGQAIFDAAIIIVEQRHIGHEYFGKFSVTLVDDGCAIHAIMSFADARDGVEFKLRLP